MANCLICYPNNADTATLSGGDWLDACPLANLQTRFRKKVIRSASLEESSTQFYGVFSERCYTTAMALVGHNLSLTATVRLVMYHDEARTKVVYDSGDCQAWPRWYKTMNLRWGDSNFWGGRIPLKLWGKVPAIFVLMLGASGFAAQATSARSFFVQIKDPLNPKGYVEVSRLYMGEDWTPQFNMSYGAQFQVVDPSIVDRALSGTKWYEKRSKYRQAVFTLKYMDEAEAINKAFMLDWLAGVTEDVLYVWDPEEPRFLQQRSFVGCISELSPLEAWTLDLHSHAYKIEESV